MPNINNKKIILVFALIFTISSYAQILIPKKDYIPEIRYARYSFTISLTSGANSSPITFGIYCQAPDSSVEVIFLNKDSFIRQFCGFEDSKANPDKINYCDEYKINPSVFNNLWKLKYAQYPFDDSNETGWGTKTGTPSSQQFTLLSEFGITNLSEHCYGHNLIRLLKSVDNAAWVGKYMQLK